MKCHYLTFPCDITTMQSTLHSILTSSPPMRSVTLPQLTIQPNHLMLYSSFGVVVSLVKWMP